MAYEKALAPECDKCGRLMVLKPGKFGKFWGCPGYPKCKNIINFKSGKKKVTQADVPLSQAIRQFDKRMTDKGIRWTDAQESILGLGARIVADSTGPLEIAPLHQTFRCCPVIVDHVRDRVPAAAHLVSGVEDTEGRGAINEVEISEIWDRIVDGDLILARRNAPIFPVAIKGLRCGRPMEIVGRDFKSDLLDLIKKVVGTGSTVLDLLTATEAWREAQTARIVAQNQGQGDPDGTAIERVNDLADCIIALSDGLERVKQVEDRIDALYKAKSKVRISTVHRAKGLEADNVWIVEPGKLPLTWENQQPWEAEQEQNILYVALTRAKWTLNYIVGEDTAQEAQNGA